MLGVQQSFTKVFKNRFRSLERQSDSVIPEDEAGCGV
jgi:hypothetical protein